LQDESHDYGHVHFVPQNTVFFDVRTCRRRGQTEGFALAITIDNTIAFTISITILHLN